MYNQLTKKEVSCGEGQKCEERQRVFKRNGIFHTEICHPKHQRVEASTGGVDAEHDEVAHVPVPNAVPCEKAMVVPFHDHFLTQFAEVTAVQEVVCINSVRTVRRTDWNNVLIGTLCREPYSH